MGVTIRKINEIREAVKRRSKKLSDNDLRKQFIEEGGQVYFNHGIQEEFEAGAKGVPLIPEGVLGVAQPPPDAQNDATSALAERIQKYRDYYKEDKVSDRPKAAEARQEEAETQQRDADNGRGPPDKVDRSGVQSPVKSQGSRETCVAHATLALLEAFPNVPDDLSEQFAHFQFNQFLNRRQDSNLGFSPALAAACLVKPQHFVCIENAWPYISSQKDINRKIADRTYGPPPVATTGKRFGIKAYKLLNDQGGRDGEGVQNPRYLETLLKDYNIVIGVQMAWDDKDRNGILEPVLTSDGKPVRKGGHAMLIVGYNRPQQYFIVKNSWGKKWGHNGYAYLHYDFMRYYAREGFIVTEIATQG